MGRIGGFLSKRLSSVIASRCAVLTVSILTSSFEAIVENSSLSAGRNESEEGCAIMVNFPMRRCTNDGVLRVEIFSGFDACSEPKLKSQPKLTLTINTWWWLIRSEVVRYFHVREPLNYLRLDQVRQAIPSGFWALLYVLGFTGTQ